MQNASSKKVRIERPLEIIAGSVFIILCIIFLCGVGWAMTEKSGVLIMTFSALSGVTGLAAIMVLMDK